VYDPPAAQFPGAGHDIDVRLLSSGLRPRTRAAVPQVPSVSLATNACSPVEPPSAPQFPADAHEIEATSSPVLRVPGTFAAVPHVPLVSLATNASVPSAAA